jgi:hypothetical protein
LGCERRGAKAKAARVRLHQAEVRMAAELAAAQAVHDVA